MIEVKSKDRVKKSDELLKAVGGLEAAQGIVDRAPESATHVVDYDHMGKYDYLKDPDTWVAWYGSHWSKPGVLIDLSDKTIVKLSELRTAIIEQIKSDRQISCSNKLAKQLLDLAGGLTAARIIDINAPEGSTYFSQCGADGLYYRETSFGYDCWKDGAWYADDFMFEESKANRTTIRLSYLRTAIADYESEQRVTELNQSVEQAKAALNTFSYEPKKAVSTHAELVLHEQIKNLNSSRNFWRVMFLAVFIFYGLAWWLV